MLSVRNFHDRSAPVVDLCRYRSVSFERAAYYGYPDETGISLTAWAGAVAVSLALWVSLARAVSAYIA